MIRMKIWLLPLIIALTAFASVGITWACSASNPQPVYICQDFTNCANGQFLEVFDHNGAPIFSVGQTGGPKTFGDSTAVYPPSSIYDPAVVTSYQAPSGTCKPPELWQSPQGIYFCVGGIWKKKL